MRSDFISSEAGVVLEPLRVFFHDVRSPLSVLSLLRKRIESTDAEAAELLGATLLQMEGLILRLEPEEITSEDEPGFSCEDLYESLQLLLKAKNLEHQDCTYHIYNLSRGLRIFSILGRLADWVSHFSNILNNSAEAGASCCVLTLDLDEEADSLCLIVEDNGCGISPERRLQLNKSRKIDSSKGGLRGRGLKGVLRELKTLQGSLSVEAVSPQGSRLILRLPVLKPDPRR